MPFSKWKLRHDVFIEEIFEGGAATEYPAFVDGARRPPDDVGVTDRSLQRDTVSAGAGKRQIDCPAVQISSAVEQPDRVAVLKGLRPPLGFLMQAEEFVVPAARNPAFRLALRAGVVIAEPPEVTVSAGLQNENVDLVGRDADVFLTQQRVQDARAGTAKTILPTIPR